jgi:hypothetical protein
MIDARRRSPDRRDDIASWLLSRGHDYDGVRLDVERIDCHLWSLPDIPQQLVQATASLVERDRC